MTHDQGHKPRRSERAGRFSIATSCYDPVCPFSALHMHKALGLHKLKWKVCTLHLYAHVCVGH